MPTVHLLNVRPGDCSIIQHGSGRVTVIDICGGNDAPNPPRKKGLFEIALEMEEAVGGNFRMCEKTTQPIAYMQSRGIKKVFRFVLSHPDMDHMDGLDRLLSEIGIVNFWHTGSVREPPEFANNSPFNEDDWLTYERLVKGDAAGVTVLTRLAGEKFKYANEDDENGNNDSLSIVAPDPELLDDPDSTDDINEGSYLLSYNTVAGKFVFPGDAHDASWEYVLQNHAAKVSDCSFLLAPHHGRDSARDYSFLDVLQPKLTWIGCSPSKYIDYRQWYDRDLPILTSNQTGNMVLEINKGFYDVWIENERFAAREGADVNIRDQFGYVFLKRVVTA